jgi:hypothetical protein
MKMGSVSKSAASSCGKQSFLRLNIQSLKLIRRISILNFGLGIQGSWLLYPGSCLLKNGAGGGSRTHKSFTSEDFKSSASANSATPALKESGGDERIRTAE